MNKRLLTTLVLLFSFLPNLRGQQPLPRPSPAPSPESTSAASQQSATREEDPDVVRITSNLVQVDAVVTKDGKHVSDLKLEDFQIFEDGKPQTITQFSYVSNISETRAMAGPAVTGPKPGPKGLPIVPVPVRSNEARRTVALVIDDLGISAETMPVVRQQLRKFLDQQLQPNDLVSILNTGGKEVGVLQQFTTDKRVLSSAVEHLRWNPCSRAGTYVFGGAGARICSAGTLDRTFQVLRFALQGMRDLPGRKSMVVFSDSLPIAEPALVGFEDPGFGEGREGLGQSVADQMGAVSSPSSRVAGLQTIAELAIRASVVIYAVDSRGLQPTGLQAMDPGLRGRTTSYPQKMTDLLSARSASLLAGREGGALIARETGGFAIYNSNDFSLHRVMDDQRGYYLIGYRPNDETFNRRFHQIKVKVKGSGLEVRTRKGFYGVTEDQAIPPALTARDRMIRSLISPFGSNDVNVRLTTIFANDAAAGPLLRSFLFLDARDLVFTRLADGIHEAKFDLSRVIFGDYGRVISRQDDKVTLRLPQARYDQVLREGIVHQFDWPIKDSGAFQFRVALHDSASSRIGAAGQFIEVPNLRNKRLAISGLLVAGAGTPVERLTSGPAVRQFQQGARLILGFEVYNAIVDQKTHLPQLSGQLRVYQDGKEVYAGKVNALDLTGQSDFQRITSGAELELGALPSGEYVIQITVQDHLAKRKENSVSQWTDFAIVK